MRFLAVVIALAPIVAAAPALAQGKAPPLKPADRSSPQATLRTFLESADAVGAYIARDYRLSPTWVGIARLRDMSETPRECLDLREVPPAGRMRVGNSAALALYETLSRIDLPPLDQVPDKDHLQSLSGDPPRWVIPDTDIAIVRIATGPRSGEFVFAAQTVARDEEYYERTRTMPYLRPVP